VVVRIVANSSKEGLRPLDPTRDLAQLADLIENAFGDELSDKGEQVLRELRLLSRFGPLGHLITGAQSGVNDIFSGFVWIQDQRVVGNVTVNQPTRHLRRWQISNVAVMDMYRRQGIARKLLEAAIDLVLRRGGNMVYLFVRDDNRSALHLYQSMGFVEVDRTTDLKLSMPVRVQGSGPILLRPLKPQEGEQLYELVLEASGRGHRWLYAIRRAQYVISGGERFFRWLESVFSGEIETHWGALTGSTLDAGIVLRLTRMLNRKPHGLKLWIRPERRGKLEDIVARDVIAILAQQPARPVYVSLPACEAPAIDALVRQGFDKLRTLILMKLDL
jgi:ribosomal protein S18 acetylase RimI-like enzyme